MVTAAFVRVREPPLTSTPDSSSAVAVIVPDRLAEPLVTVEAPVGEYCAVVLVPPGAPLEPPGAPPEPPLGGFCGAPPEPEDPGGLLPGDGAAAGAPDAWARGEALETGLEPELLALAPQAPSVTAAASVRLATARTRRRRRIATPSCDGVRCLMLETPSVGLLWVC